MGAKITKRYSSRKSLLNFLNFFLNFCLQYPHIVTFCDILISLILTIFFLNMLPYCGKFKKKAINFL